MFVRLRDLLIVLLNFSLVAKAGFCSGKLYGFPCCKKTVNNPEYDKNGYAYGTENGKSCIVPKTCANCVTKGDANRKSTSNRNNMKGDSKSQSSNFCSGELYGFPCCKKTVNNPEYDKNGYAYGKENGKSCIVPKGCKSCVQWNDNDSNNDDHDENWKYHHGKIWWSDDFCSGTLKGYRCCEKIITNPKYDSNGYASGIENGYKCIVPKGCKRCVKDEIWGPRYSDDGFCIGNMFGFKCCKQVVSHPKYDTEGYAYGEEGNEICIVPKDCKKCVSTEFVTRTFTSTEMSITMDSEWSVLAATLTATTA